MESFLRSNGQVCTMYGWKFNYKDNLQYNRIINQWMITRKLRTRKQQENSTHLHQNSLTSRITFISLLTKVVHNDLTKSWHLLQINAEAEWKRNKHLKTFNKYFADFSIFSIAGSFGLDFFGFFNPREMHPRLKNWNLCEMKNFFGFESQFGVNQKVWKTLEIQYCDWEIVPLCAERRYTQLE